MVLKLSFLASLLTAFVMLRDIAERSQRGYSKFYDPDRLIADVAYLLGYISSREDKTEAYIMNANKDGWDAFRKI